MEKKSNFKRERNERKEEDTHEQEMEINYAKCCADEERIIINMKGEGWKATNTLGKDADINSSLETRGLNSPKKKEEKNNN